MLLVLFEQLSAQRPKLLLHAELINVSLYHDYVAWGGLACPSQLFREDVLNLFKAVAADNLVLTIFRDKVGNHSRCAITPCAVTVSMMMIC